ncbi:hypothetical protein ALC62_12661 [Cyphomyrmex costatus]|uniref:Envelope fusion protein n=1 Tax=Cyphomyrmex costatus TaxID=456900 RepID=A0A151IB01_9HYME|nr:hypothetical protein ALC62_12661 [Cyphomyrmex costatus]
MCEYTLLNDNTCKNMHTIAERGHDRPKNLITAIQAIYTAPINKRCGLIDGLGTIAKSLFGTMDANDEKIIKEQLTLLHNEAAAIRHAVSNQLKIINSTIKHISSLEENIQQNERSLRNSIQIISNQRHITSRHQAIDEYFTLIIELTNNLIKDTEDILQYLTYAKEGFLHPGLMSVNHVIDNLKGAAATLPEGLYFPFSLDGSDWINIEKATTISAYCDRDNIYTILQFPLTASPTYEILHAIPLPVYDHDNKFVSVEINEPYIAVDTEQHTYITITEYELQECSKIGLNYICERNHAINRITSDAICEIQLYLKAENQYKHCNHKFVTAHSVLWKKLENSWLFSAPTKKVATIKCKNYPESKEILENTGKITLQNNCKLITSDVVIRSRLLERTKIIESYLPNVNITLLRNAQVLDNKTDQIKLKQLVRDPNELKYLGMKLNKIYNDLQNQEFYKQKEFIYPMATSGFIILTIVIIAMYFLIKKILRKRQQGLLPPLYCEANSSQTTT